MKKLIAGVMTAILIMSSFAVCYGASSTDQAVKELYRLGLVKGSNGQLDSKSLELDRYATRIEEATMLIRLIGKEAKAAYQKNSHPFKDVPSWASDNVGWLYENYVINGVSSNRFGASDTATVKQFSAMILRVLGYSDSKGDFKYENAVDYALKKGIVDKEIASHNRLSRENMFLMCHNALNSYLKNSSRKLIEKLSDEKAVDKQVAIKYGLIKENSISNSFPDVLKNLGDISVKSESGKFKIKFTMYVEEHGVRVFVRERSGTAITEIPMSGSVYFKKGQKNYLGGGSAGYITDVTVYGLDTSKKYEFIVLKTSSESELYKVEGKSGTAYN